MVYLEAKSPGPAFKPEPSRLSLEARHILERLRAEHIGAHADYRRDGYEVLGGVSQFDGWMLRAGEKLHLMAVRRSVGERVRRKLEGRYGHQMDIQYEAGGVFVKSGVSQKNVLEERHFSFHPGGMTFYARRRRAEAGSGSSAYAHVSPGVDRGLTILSRAPIAVVF